MSTLIISLPLEAVSAQTEFDFVVTEDGLSVAQTGRSRAEALPLPGPLGGTCIAVAPLRAVSWQVVTLPAGVAAGSARMRAVLDGLLEDKLLDDTALLHVSLPPTYQPGMTQWIAVCDRRWLAMAVQGLEVAKRPVSRVVPDWGPPVAPGRWHVTGSLTDPQLVVCSDRGVGMFPFNTAALEGFPPADKISADPALVSLATQRLQRPVMSLSQAEHLLQVMPSAWDLSLRLQMRSLANRGKLEWLQAPRWRFARWAAVALVSVNLLGLNALAWVEQQQLDAQREVMRQLLTRSFPAIKTVPDVPLLMVQQMALQVRLLEQARAAPSTADLDVMLGVLSRALPAGDALKGVEFANGQLGLSGLSLNPAQASALAASLQTQGFSIRRDGASWLLQPAANRAGKS